MAAQRKRLFKIIKHSYFWVFVSLALIIGSCIIFFANLRLSVEFTGGIELNLDTVQNQESLVGALEEGIINAGFEKPQVNINKSDIDTKLLVALPFKDDAQVKEVSSLVSGILINQ